MNVRINRDYDEVEAKVFAKLTKRQFFAFLISGILAFPLWFIFNSFMLIVIIAIIPFAFAIIKINNYLSLEKWLLLGYRHKKYLGTKRRFKSTSLFFEEKKYFK